jgi:hypothetical protein
VLLSRATVADSYRQVIVAAPVNDVPLVLVQVIAFEPDVVQSPLSSACESVTVFEELSREQFP